MFPKRCLSDFGCAALLVGVLRATASAQPALPDANLARSVSGQFIVTRNQSGPVEWSLATTPAVGTNAGVVRLEPALLSVLAERINQKLWHDLGINSTAPWQGKIFLILRPARSLDDNVTVLSRHFADGWNYRVALPDVLPRTRFLRAMTGVVLLEFANRGGQVRSAEIPAWLTDGLSQQLLATGTVELVLSSPTRTVNGLVESRTVATQRGIDPLIDELDIL